MKPLFLMMCVAMLTPITSQAIAQSSPLEKLLDDTNEGDIKIHRDIVLREQLLKSNQRNLALIQVVPKKSQSGTNAEYQASELTDTIILMHGGSQAISDSLYGRVFFTVALSNTLMSPEKQKCISDGMSMQNLYAVLYDKSYAYVTQQGPEQAAKELNALIDTGFAQHWHNVSVLTLASNDQESSLGSVSDYMATMKKDAKLNDLIEGGAMSLEGVFGLLPASVDQLAAQTSASCNSQNNPKM